MIMSKATRVEVRVFGRQLKRGMTLVNRWKEHNWPAGTRHLTVLHDVRSLAFFILEDQTGKTTWMRTRTLLERYRVEPSLDYRRGV